MDKNTFEIFNREHLEETEEKTLAPYAKKSAGVHTTRVFEEPEHEYRTAFQRDRDRIIHSRAFRRLKHKRQVFLTTESDHYRTRITHTLEVAQLSRTMARALGLNEDLVEAIALGHDLGHTPFGHLGEVVLNDIMVGKRTFPDQPPGRNFGGFKHNYQSVRIVDRLERKYAFAGLNLTAPVREGILKHTRLRRGKLDFQDFVYDGLLYEQDVASILEGQVVAICDEIAQRTHDLEDGIRAGLVDVPRVRQLQIVVMVEEKLQIADRVSKNSDLYPQLMIRGLINHLVQSVIETTLANLEAFHRHEGRLDLFDEEIVCFSAEVDPLQKELNKFIYSEIIDFSRVQWADELGEKLIFRLFQAYFQDPALLPSYLIQTYLDDGKVAPAVDLAPSTDQLTAMRAEPQFFRMVCDHIAGMTDHFALHETQKLSQARKLDARDLRLDVALGTG